MLILVQAVFVIFFILHMSFVKLSIGLPIKDLSLIALFCLLFLGYPRWSSTRCRACAAS